MNKKASTSFLKQSSKKLLLTGGVTGAGAKVAGTQRFFAAFFQKRSACFSGVMALALYAPQLAWAQSAPAQPGYFVPSDTVQGPGGAVLQAQPVPMRSPVYDSHLIDNLPPPAPVEAPVVRLPWYETDWGVLGIGVVATGLTALEDRNINNYDNKRLSVNFRQNVALREANILELAPLAFAGATMVQSPFSDPQLAHASSIAVTSAAIVTAISFGTKYVVGRERPGGVGSDPFKFQPVDAQASSFSIGAVFPGSTTNTSSFPSGHTDLAFALITPYAELYHNPWLYSIPVAVGVGRILAVDGHWASDVVAGGFIGWLTADLTRRYFPSGDYGLILFGDGQREEVGISGRF
jgi:membrane-associated phospholipid phosphatase